MSELKFLKNYFNSLLDLIDNHNYFEDLISTKKILCETNKAGKKTLIFGNGGSAAIASHFSVDMTKNGGVRCINFNESDLLTCFANDYGYENWVKQALKFYSDSGDLVILISASGNSKNIINAAKYIKKNKNKLITFTGFNGKNKLSKYGNINFVVNSESFNFIENTHQYWLLSLVDLFSNFRK